MKTTSQYNLQKVVNQIFSKIWKGFETFKGTFCFTHFLLMIKKFFLLFFLFLRR